MSAVQQSPIIAEEQIQAVLSASQDVDAAKVREILAKALELKGLNESEVGVLCAVRDHDLREELYHTARKVKEEIYGRRLVLFAPLYVSNMCANECSYCAFRASSKALHRRALTQEEVAHETEILINQGHKRILLVAGESYPKEGFSYVTKCIETIYSVKNGPGEIRRVNANVAPLSVEEFRDLKAAKIGTYQLFQETYHQDTYKSVHLAGRKRDYNWRVTAMDRAMTAGIDDVGIGVLFGLYDWRFEILAIMQHAAHLEKEFGVGCHTISVPRIEPALNAPLSERPPYPVCDDDFRKVVAILRMAVPYTGIIMSTRETPEMRSETFSLGVSQISAGSRTNPGGYTDGEEEYDGSQFSLGDHRTLDEVVRDAAQLGYIPSFCTGCYRKGRTGADFMDLAKPGLIKNYCDVNAMSTFVEYLQNYASAETVALGEQCMANILATMPEARRKRAEGLMSRVRAGERDVYV
ncbi:MAG TPA: [FeFe] hydrogenase H-cluster radical SAM maturase HydG [Candidatus Hydrogenedentes bacterium]|nr:[FeFe] hydrogenase H-cluster radical SAM maturase HydG [Candidatus Hydrogenedentota bacterium]